MGINWSRRKYTEEQFIRAVKSSKSYAEVARRLGLTVYGSTYDTIKKTIYTLGLSTEHMTGQAHLRGKTHNWSPKKPLHEVLTKSSHYSSSTLKKRLFNEGLKRKQCQWCGIVEWRNQPAPLALDHINGDKWDNRLENLRILCYNCHGQTETYCSKNMGGNYGGVDKSVKSAGSNPASKDDNLDASSILASATSRLMPIVGRACIDCGNMVSYRATRCKSCSARSQAVYKVEWPSRQDLVKMVDKLGYLATGRILGVSDNAVRKRLKNHP